ncbi:Crp/Fnr family transcriptional regulator [Paenibacillus frigoriresistens]|uniref:Crp/Fnr family transcriptional regulator n=1 Tax=Paenibacillus alginolyticus TaxID=59839 RepID=UPI001565E7E4|nr:Crp/Fnr family transcriptional regulator [Paenibacillus frigoriresistens]NRF93784.1 Crp/Fnr family transcriptional regulator [Paenibacillus frigoriresistens]
MLTVLELLHNNEWLGKLLRSMPHDLFEYWTVRCYHSKDVICEQGESAAAFQILVSGELIVEHMVEDGHLYTHASRFPGQMLGDIELAAGLPYLYRVSAVNDCVVISLKADIYQKWIEKDVRFTLFINKVIADKLYDSSIKFIEHTFIPLRRKMIRYFYEQIKYYDFQKNPLFIIVLTREQLASQLAVTVRSVNRMMKQLKEEQIMVITKNRMTFTERNRQLMERELSTTKT